MNIPSLGCTCKNMFLTYLLLLLMLLLFINCFCCCFHYYYDYLLTYLSSLYFYNHYYLLCFLFLISYFTQFLKNVEDYGNIFYYDYICMIWFVIKKLNLNINLSKGNLPLKIMLCVKLQLQKHFLTSYRMSVTYHNIAFSLYYFLPSPQKCNLKLLIRTKSPLGLANEIMSAWAAEKCS